MRLDFTSELESFGIAEEFLKSESDENFGSSRVILLCF